MNKLLYFARRFFALTAICCAIWILGLAGASDLNTMPLSEIIIQMCIAMPSLIISILIGGSI